MNWLKKLVIAAEYPGGSSLGKDYYGKDILNFDRNKKIDYWGFKPEGHYDQWTQESEFAKNPYLSKIPSKNIEFLIDHISQKYMSLTEPDFIEKYNFADDISGYYFPHDSELYQIIENELDQNINKLCRKYGIEDSKFIGSLSSMCINETVLKITKKLKIKHQNSTFKVRVYGSSQAYGGPEEGGWWYNNKQLVEEVDASGLQKANQVKSQLEKKYKKLGKDSFYEDLENSHKGVSETYYHEDADHSNETEGMTFPKGWVPSSFEKFYVQIELSDEPISSTKQIPHYE